MIIRIPIIVITQHVIVYIVHYKEIVHIVEKVPYILNTPQLQWDLLPM